MGRYSLKRLMRKLTPLRRAQGVLAVLALVTLITPREVEKYGDNYQVALPLLALGCQIANGQGLAYFGRYAVHFAGLHATKRGLGDAEIAQRPRGGLEGFPSGHTSTAVFGAATLVQSCVIGSPIAQSAVILAAGFTGASRIESGAHDIWQVLVGAIWGLICAMAFRQGSPSRAYARRTWEWLRGKV